MVKRRRMKVISKKEGRRIEMKRLLPVILTAALALSSTMTAFAHHHRGNTTPLCPVSECTQSGEHVHDGCTYRAHYSGDGCSSHHGSGYRHGCHR